MVENPLPEPKPLPRKRRSPVPKPVAPSEYDAQGWLSGRKHDEVIRKTMCGCGEHELSACFDILYSGKTTARQITEVFNRYADINLKVHNSNREAGWKTPSQEAEEILKLT